jgi:hypothetical protein
LKCNYYSQGCDGGFGLEIARFSKENKLVSETNWNQILRNQNDNTTCYRANQISKIICQILLTKKAQQGVSARFYEMVLGSYPPKTNRIPNSKSDFTSGIYLPI